MEITNIHDANLLQLVESALAGKEVILGEKGKPLVKMVALEQKQMKKKRQPGGSWKGKIKISEDFDQEDEEIIKMFEEES